MSPIVSSNSAPVTRRVWPITAMLVVVAVLLMLVDGFGAAIQSASFFGDSPSRADLIAASMASLTSLPAFAAMICFGWQRGSRTGLWLIAAPALVMLLVGVNLLATTGDPRDPSPDGTARLADVFGNLTFLNWAATVVFVGGAVATYLLRRRTRHTEKASAA